MEEAQGIYGTRDGLQLCSTCHEALKEAHALVICTEWKPFWAPDFEVMAELLKEPVIFDGRNFFDPALMSEKGFTYFGIGRSNKRFILN